MNQKNILYLLCSHILTNAQQILIYQQSGSFPFIPAVVKEFNMGNKCLEIGIVWGHSFPPIISDSTFKAQLNRCITWEGLLGAGPLHPHAF